MTYNHLDLFSGTHSWGKATHKRGIHTTSLDRDIGATDVLGKAHTSANHIQEDILSWDYRVYPRGHFTLITASPVCTWWSVLRYSNIGRKIGDSDVRLTRDMIEDDIMQLGVPMIDRLFEILEYFQPEYFVIENPQSGRLKEYIGELIPYRDVDYCKYGYEYRKRTRIWTNIPNFEPRVCAGACHHSTQMSRVTSGWGRNRFVRYRIPQELIESLLGCIEKEHETQE
jgi:site-specific DNA-cytosine methylase